MIKALAAKKSIIALVGVCILFAWVSKLSTSSIKQLQGNARVINYIGIVRGATQRLVKQELRGNANDTLMARLDSIVEELISGEGPNSLIALPDPAFQGNMAKVREKWGILKREIREVRRGNDATKLYDLSENYFILVDETVSLAEEYTEKQVAASNRTLNIANAVFLLAIFTGLVILLSTRALKRRADMLGALAFIDPLTKMPNRAACHRELARLAQRPPRDDLAVFMFDMNNLKRANDALGHNEGDQVIANFGHLIMETFRDLGFAGRYGGDEFVALIRKADENTALTALDRLAKSTERYNQSVDHPLKRVSYAGGFSVGNLSAKTIEELMQQADRNMYEQKRNSRESIMERVGERVSEIASRLVQVAGQVSAASQDFASTSSGQRSVFTDFSKATQTLHTHAEEYSRLAEDASRIIGDIKDHAESGDADMKRLASSMTNITESVKEINAVLRTINDIAFQTNILSLNAAVEAARAGRHGKGFSVVAEEVRNLANRSARSVDATNAVVIKSEENVEMGRELSQSTSTHLNRIVDTSHTASEYLDKVAARANEQKTVLKEIVTNLSKVETMTDHSSATALENARAAKQLFSLASNMRELLDFGKEVKDDNDVGKDLSNHEVMARFRLDRDGEAETV